MREILFSFLVGFSIFGIFSIIDLLFFLPKFLIQGASLFGLVLAYIYARNNRSPSNVASVGGLMSSALCGALLAGMIGFLVGFLGPILLSPESNQGPLLGIFITGPVGVVVGAIGGMVLKLKRQKNIEREISEKEKNKKEV